MKTRHTRKIRGITEEMWQQSTNPLQISIAPRSWPSRHNHSLTRKCGLATCAYVLHSPIAFRSPLALQIAQTVQQQFAVSPPGENLQESTRSKLLLKFPNVFAVTRYGFFFDQRSKSPIDQEQTRLGAFIHAVLQLGGRHGMNQIATMFLNLVRQEAQLQSDKELDTLRDTYKATVARKPKVLPLTSITTWRCALERWFRMLPPQWANPVDSDSELPGFRDAVLAMLPEAERATFDAEKWDRDSVPATLRLRIGTLAAEPQVAAVGKQMANIVRDILGNPFRPVAVLSEWREANFGAALRIAEHIVATGNYGDVPILADALEDAGCSDEELLNFCRNGEHYAGCWVVDAVLGRN